MKKIFLFLLMFNFVFVLLGCNKDLKITGSNTLELGCSQKLEVNSNSPELKWETSDENIAQVIDGLVIGNSLGVVTISAVLGDESATFTIEVIPCVLDITITGFNTLYVGEESKFEYQLSKKVNSDVEWSTSNEEILIIDQDGKAIGLKEGSVTISLKVAGNEETFDVNVCGYELSILKINKLKVGNTFLVEIKTNPINIKSEYKFKSGNSDVATINDEGLVTALSVGKTLISCTNKYDNSIKSTFLLEVVEYDPLNVLIDGEKEVVSGKHIILDSKVTGDGSKELIWESSNPSVAIVYQGIVLGLKPGTATIKAMCAEDKYAQDSIDITVKELTLPGPNTSDLEKVNKIIDKMTLAQKVGQMFVVGFGGTSMPNDLTKAIEEYHFGNVIYLGYNVTNPQSLTKLSNDIQNKMVESNLVPALITIDQEGGRVARLTNGGTHFISQMAMAATNDYNNTYLQSLAIGKELISYGINANFAPVLDVNNNPNNPIIGIRSYADDPVIVSLYGNNAIKGYQEAKVIGTSKHFPGHGNTSVDSHVGLPVITSNIEDLYAVELAPFISSINNGIDAIMTTHIIFQAIDSEYPATLSEKVLTKLLREEFGFNGLIVTDGMEMDAIDQHYGSYAEAAVLAIKAGADILTYTTIANPKIAYNGIIKAIENNEITEERINESVRRILLIKQKYGILDNYIIEDVNRSQMLAEHEQLNLKLAMDSLTLVKGDFKGLDKSKSTLIISPTLSESLGTGLKDNSFANYAANYLKANGHSKCDYRTVKANIGSTELSSILTVAQDYDQIVVAFSNVKTSNYKNSANFVKELIKNNQNVIVIALDTPYDYLAYGSTVNNYICIYGYQKVSTIALTKYLNGEFEATGVLPVNKDLFK